MALITDRDSLLEFAVREIFELRLSGRAVYNEAEASKKSWS